MVEGHADSDTVLHEDTLGRGDSGVGKILIGLLSLLHVELAGCKGIDFSLSLKLLWGPALYHAD